jgi:hypothetical protein
MPSAAPVPPAPPGFGFASRSLVAAVVPHPPLLAPELSGAAHDPELARLRAACHEAVAAVARAGDDGTDLLLVVGDGPVWGAAVPGAGANLAPWGAHVRVELPVTGVPALPGLPEPSPLDELPPSLAVAALLLDRLPARPRVAAFTVPAATPPRAAAGIGRALAAAAGLVERGGLLVMADGSARRTPRSPGTFHPGAEAADTAVAAALAAADTDALLALDPAACAELWLGGRVPLQVMAGALAGVPVTGRVLYDGAPWGVGYIVATWLRAGDGGAPARAQAGTAP